MRLKAVQLSGFRGFGTKQQFDLNADAIIIVGSNGQGKTSLFDGIMWALVGRIPRLGHNDNIVSLYSDSGEARVSLDLQSSNNSICQIVRSYDGVKQQLSLNVDGEQIRDPLSTQRVIQMVWPEALLTADSELALSTALTRSIYLQQDLVRQFIESDKEQDRFNTVSELVGVGRVTELQHALERSKLAWSKATNQFEKEEQLLYSRMKSREEYCNRLANSDSDKFAAIELDWQNWWTSLRKTSNLAPGESNLLPGTSQASALLDVTLKKLIAFRRSVELERDNAAQLLSECESRATSELPNETVFKNALDIANKTIGELQTALSAAERQAADERLKITEICQAQEELNTLAKLALRHLKPICPVCGQPHDLDATRGRLQSIIDSTSIKDDKLPSISRIADLVTSLRSQEQSRANIEALIQQAEEANREGRLWMQRRDRRVSELGLSADPSENIINSLRKFVSDHDSLINILIKLQRSGEELSLTISEASEFAMRSETIQEIEALKVKIAETTKSLQERQQTGEMSGRILEGLRDATFFVVDGQLKRIEPLLKRIYATIEPHPAFRTVEFLTAFSRGRGRLETRIQDTFADKSSESPEVILSSSQMNALAVSIFLAFNLGVKTLPLETAMLDDPIQSLDDVNLLGLVDLLRRVRLHRQLLISTHDSRFGRLLERKLRPVSADQRTIVVDFRGWNRSGPEIETREVSRDKEPMRFLSVI